MNLTTSLVSEQKKKVSIVNDRIGYFHNYFIGILIKIFKKNSPDSALRGKSFFTKKMNAIRPV